MQRGFSLVELSIVLVILGLLTGGILAGQSLIKAAELRAVGTEFNRYITATQTFRDKYFAVPGDMGNAQSFWGIAAAGATCKVTASTGTETCNGDANGSIHPNLTNTAETFRFWQHLASAGLIEGTYSGTWDGTTVHSSTGRNAPKSKFSTGYWYVRDWAVAAAEPPASQYLLDYSNSFMLGGFDADAAPRVPIFTPEQLWNIDTKTDDGKPGQGKVIARTTSTIANCTTSTSTTDFAGEYRLNSNTPLCAMMVRQLF